MNGSCRLSPPAATLTPASSSARHGREPTRGRAAELAALEVQVRLWQRHHADPNLGQGGGHLALRRSGWTPRLTTWLAAIDPGEAGRATSISSTEGEHRRIDRLVHVQVEPDPGIGGGAGEDVHGTGRVLIDGRAPTDQVDTRLQRLSKQGPVVGAGQSGDRGRAQGDDLDVQVLAEGLPDRGTASTARRSIRPDSMWRADGDGTVRPGTSGSRPTPGRRCPSTVRSTRLARHAWTAPSSDPSGLRTVSAVNALSRWAWGSTKPGSRT